MDTFWTPDGHQFIGNLTAMYRHFIGNKLQRIGIPMKRKLTLEYWEDDNWYVGKLREVPDVFSQGESLKELEENIKDAYALLMSELPRSLTQSWS